MEGREDDPRLTVRDRILVHLSENMGRQTEYEAPAAATQIGVADAVDVDRKHVPEYVRPLIAEDLVQERSARVRGRRQRVKTYGLTARGRAEAARLRGELLSRIVQAETPDGGLRAMPLREVVREYAKGAALLDLLRDAKVRGRVRPTGGEAAVDLGVTKGFVERLAGMPGVVHFVARRPEMEAVTSESDRPRIFIVRGVAGIGKSSFGAKACEILRGTRNLFWHRVRPWDTFASILASQADFLALLGRPGLRSVLSRGQTARAAEVLAHDLPGTRAFLVFDDAHEVSVEAAQAFVCLKEALTEAGDVRLLFLTRKSLSFYDRRDVLLTSLVREMDLPGLTSDEARELIVSKGLAPNLINIARKLGGNPLSLELMGAASKRGSLSAALGDVHRFIEEEVYSGLSDAERQMMKLASLYRIPVPQRSFFPDSLSHDVLVSLMDRSLVRSVGSDRYEVHDTIRDFFQTRMAPSERNVFVGFATDHLRELGSQAQEAGDFARCVDALSNALELLEPDERRAEFLEALGIAADKLGDLPETLAAYREALALTRDTVWTARLHRRMASALLFRGDDDAASSEIQAGLSALGEREDIERARIDLLRGELAGDRAELSWQHEEAMAAFRGALEAFRRTGDIRGEAEALGGLAFTELHAPGGNLAEGRRCLERSLELSLSLADTEAIATARNQLAHFYMFHVPDVDEAMEQLTSIEASPAILNWRTKSDTSWWKGALNLEIRADFPAAEANFQDVASISRKTYDQERLYVAGFQLAVLAYYRGEIPEARRTLEELWKESRSRGWFLFHYGIRAMWTAAECALLTGNLPAFREVVAGLDEPALLERLNDRVVVVPILRGLDCLLRRDEAGFHAALAEALVAANRGLQVQEAPIAYQSFLAPFFYGIGLRALGQLAEAAPHLARAYEILRKFGLKARHDVLSREADRFTEVLSQARTEM